jgi:hypothetical protein
MLIEAHSVVVDSVYDNRPTGYGCRSIDGPLKGILKQRGTQPLAVLARVDGQTGEQHDRYVRTSRNTL